MGYLVLSESKIPLPSIPPDPQPILPDYPQQICNLEQSEQPELSVLATEMSDEELKEAIHRIQTHSYYPLLLQRVKRLLK